MDSAQREMGAPRKVGAVGKIPTQTRTSRGQGCSMRKEGREMQWFSREERHSYKEPIKTGRRGALGTGTTWVVVRYSSKVWARLSAWRVRWGREHKAT